jgi:hypothetical protein
MSPFSAASITVWALLLRKVFKYLLFSSSSGSDFISKHHTNSRYWKISETITYPD